VIIRVSELPGEGLTIADPARPSLAYQDRSWHLDHVRLHVARDGMEVVVAGDVDATVPQTCGRCLEAFPVVVHAAIDLRFMPRPASADSHELSPDDFETDFYVDDQLDLAAVVETETTLALPMKPLCRSDCRGLCPACGGNRNLVACACPERPPDPRLGGLGGLAARLDHSRSDH
jgi:uncharacterized protein